jgi:cytochrome c oxidase subunit III
MSFTIAAQQPTLAARATRALDHRKLGMWLFLGSEVMFFGGLISTFVHFKARNPAASEILNIPVTMVNTFLLLASSYAVVRALSAIRRNDALSVWNNLILTWFLGVGFLMGQALEFSKLSYEGVTLQTIFGSTFFVTTGFHGFHVFVGLVWLSTLLIKVYRRKLARASHDMQLEIFGLYWHFVDIVWIILFTVIYLVR